MSNYKSKPSLLEEFHLNGLLMMKLSQYQCAAGKALYNDIKRNTKKEKTIEMELFTLSISPDSIAGIIS